VRAIIRDPQRLGRAPSRSSRLGPTTTCPAQPASSADAEAAADLPVLRDAGPLRHGLWRPVRWSTALSAHRDGLLALSVVGADEAKKVSCNK
jgi:hypothetical protein